MYSAALARLLQKAKPSNATASSAPRPIANRVFVPSFKVFSLLIGLNFDRFIVFWRLLARIPHCKSQKVLSHLERHRVGREGYKAAGYFQFRLPMALHR